MLALYLAQHLLESGLPSWLTRDRGLYRRFPRLQDEKLKKKVKVRRQRGRFPRRLGRRSRGRTCGLPGVGFGALYRAELSACLFYLCDVRRHGAAEPRDNRSKSELILEEVNARVKFPIFHTVE